MAAITHSIGGVYHSIGHDYVVWIIVAILAIFGLYRVSVPAQVLWVG